MTRSRGRMTAPATSAATSAGEARPEASGAIWERLGRMLAPLWIAPVYGLWRKKNDFGAIFVRYSAGPGQFQSEKREIPGTQPTGGSIDPAARPTRPGDSGASRADSDHNPHAQVSKMAYAWPKDQTPSNY